MASRPQALVVDADRESRDRCICLLQEEGFDCHPADSGAAALCLQQARAFELLVCDLGAGDRDTLELIERARKGQPPPGILVLSHPQIPENAQQVVRALGCPCLVKPIDPIELGRAVAWVMHARHLATGALSPGQLEALYRMATTANSEADLTQLLDGLLGICIDALGADSGSVMLATGTTPRVLTITASRGLARREIAPIAFGQSVAGWVALHQRPLRLAGPLDAYPQFAGLVSNPAICESMTAPIAFRRQILGTLSVSSKTPDRLGPEKLALVMSAADIAGAAIQRSRLEQGREHQDRLAVLGQLSASLAHELNNPLACIHANVAALNDLLGEAAAQTKVGDLRAELSEMLRDMNDGAKRMISLTQNLKAAVRKSSEKVATFDLNELLRRAEILVRPQFKHRVTFDVELGGPLEVLGTSERILQVVINLLVNAAQAVERKGQIGLSSRVHEGWALVEVSDNGPGISPEVAAQLFEPFFTTKPEGTGLGLSISRQIALEHGGELTFTTALGKGTCFQLRLPGPQSAATRKDRAVVLIVDDEPALIRAMVRVMERDFELLTACSPADALALAAGKKLDLIFTDYSMPVQNGVALIRALRAQGHTAPAALVTAVADTSDVTEALKEGLVSLVIQKPWNPAALGATAARLIRGE